MFNRKRLCPYQDSENEIVDQFRNAKLKKQCLHLDQQQMVWDHSLEQCVKEKVFPIERMECTFEVRTTEMQKVCSYPRQGLDIIRDVTTTGNINNNNNSMHITPTDVCPRCQAGESGHYGHIGR